MKYDADISQKEFEIRKMTSEIERYKNQVVEFDTKVKDNETLMETVTKSMLTFNKHKE